MSRKPNTAAALADILKAKRGDNQPTDPVSAMATPAAVEAPSNLSPAPLPTPAPAAKIRRNGKSSDKTNYSQFSVYLRKDTRKKVGRALDDADTGQDFSELVQQLLEQWLTSRT